jgi:hypothetical protein
LNYTYTPNDIAVFLLKADFTLSDEQVILHDLWETGKHIARKYLRDEALFKWHIRAKLASYMHNKDGDLSELALIMRDVDPDFVLKNPEYAEDYILQYFKVIRLELMYINGRNYYKIKLRRLLRQFGYERRAQSIVQNINRALTLLSLEPFLRGYAPTDIMSAGLNDMIMIRLK